MENQETTTPTETTEKFVEPSKSGPVHQDVHDQRVEQLLQHHERKRVEQNKTLEQRMKEEQESFDNAKLDNESWQSVYESMPEPVQRAMKSLRADYTRKTQEIAKERRKLEDLQSNLTNNDAYQQLQKLAQQTTDGELDPFNPQSFQSYIDTMVAQRLQAILEPMAQQQLKVQSQRKLESFMDDHPELRTDNDLRTEVRETLLKNESMTLEDAYWVVRGKRSKQQEQQQHEYEQQQKLARKQVADRISSGQRTGFTAPADKQLSATDIYEYLLKQKK